MRFYYENSSGDNGVFSEKDLIKAIYSVWNIEGTLYKIPLKTTLRQINDYQGYKILNDVIFSSWDDNELNNELLKEYGYYMIDGEVEREIRKIEDNSLVEYDWSEVRDLI